MTVSAVLDAAVGGDRPRPCWAITPDVRPATPPRGGCPVGRGGRRELGGRQALVGCRARKGVVWVVADPAGRTSASEPKATEARPRRGAELEAMIETRGAQPSRFTRLGLVPSSSRATPSTRVGRSQQCNRIAPWTAHPPHNAQRRRSSQRQWCRSVRRVEPPPAAPATVAPPRDPGQKRHRRARQRVHERAPAVHDRRPRQGVERRPGQGRRSAIAHRERRRDPKDHTAR